MSDLPRVLLLFLAAVNPHRVASLWPEGTTRSARLTAAGVTTAAVAALALWSEPLLDLLDVSRESFRIAAGAVLVASGLRSIVTRPARFDELPPGWRGVLAPLTFPILLDAAVVVAAVSSGADDGTAVTTVAAAAALATAALVEEPGRAWVRVAVGRLWAAGLVAFGFGLVVSGVLDV